MTLGTSSNGTKQDDSDLLKDVKQDLKDYHNILDSSLNNGLFGKIDQAIQSNEEYVQLKKLLHDAKHLIDETSPKIAEATDALHDFLGVLNLADKKRGIWWRVNNRYAIFEWIYLTISPFFLWYLIVPQFSIISSLKLANATFLGGLGGVAQGYYWLWQRVSDMTFRNVWWFWVLSLPLGGAIFGAMTYLLLSGGVVSVTTGTLNENAAVFFSALAGFSWKDFVAFVANLWKQQTSNSSN